MVVIGSGIAETEVALHLSRRGGDVIMLESGREAFVSAIQALNDATFTARRHRDLDPDAGYHAYLPRGMRGASRIRQFAAQMQYAPKPRFCARFSLGDATQGSHELLEHVIYLKPIYETRRQTLRRLLRRGPACRDGIGAVAANASNW